MPIITLTTDMGSRDYYVAGIKGAIYKELPDAVVVDISHDVKPWDILQASFIIKNAYADFPSGTVHIIGVDTELHPDKPHVAILYDGHYFIGADNGVFSLMFDKIPEKIVELNLAHNAKVLTFPTRDIFVKAACHILRGGTLEVIGKEKEGGLRQLAIGKPATDEHTIFGKVIYVDNYENVICNINAQTFKEISKGRPFTIYKGRTNFTIEKIANTYRDVDEGEILVLFNSLGYMEIAMNRGNASGLLGLRAGDQIRITFES